MRLLIFLVIVSAALADTVVIDSAGNVLSASEGTLVSSAEGTAVAVPNLATISAADPVYDTHGRCRWTASAGNAPTRLATPRWPAALAVRRAAMRRAINAWGELARQLDEIERWQADPELVAIRDRTVEATAIANLMAQLKAAMGGP